MLEIHAHIRPSRTVRSELVCDHQPWRAGLLADELGHELLRCAPIPAALDRSVKNKAVSTNCIATRHDHQAAENSPRLIDDSSRLKYRLRYEISFGHKCRRDCFA
jgi:hypothetical protein